jgi:hypothetical protein
MKIATLAMVALGLCVSSTPAFTQDTVNVPSDRNVVPLTRSTNPPMPVPPPPGVTEQAQNPMPSASGGFNNNEINGKSRNPDSTTPGTGPANANPNASP